MTNDVKIPSVISYSPRSAQNEQQFGADLSPDAVSFLNTKLELDLQDSRLEELDLILQVLEGMKNLNFDNIKASKGYPAYTWKKPEDIVTDYLTRVYNCFVKSTEYMEEIRKTAPVDIIITVPVVGTLIALPSH
jgi:methionine synthase II (cobalamin-independent)